MMYGVQDLLSIFSHEQDRHMSSELDDGVDNTVKDSSKSFKETNQEGFYQTYKIRVSLLFDLLEFLDDNVHASVNYGSMHDTSRTFEFKL